MKIAEVSEKYGLSADTLRYYERAGLLGDIPRDRSGMRDYGEEECNRVEFIKCMRDAGVSVAALAEYMRLMPQGDATVTRRKEILEEQRDQIQANIDRIQHGLDRLNYKIDNYETVIAVAEKHM